MDNLEMTIKKYICDELLFDKGEDYLSNETPVLGDVIDSMGLQMLIPFLETEFDISIPDIELVPDNFENIKRMAEFVRRIKAA